MPSNSLQHWKTIRILELDEIDNAHAQVGGGRGHRRATQQINYAYAVLLSSQFQGFCRDLHSEAAEFIADAVTPRSLRPVLHHEFKLHRRLDRGNPNPGNIGADFNRLGIHFWNQVRTPNHRNAGRIGYLEELNDWRNAIAHQDFTPLGSSSNLRLTTVRQWRQACEQLADAFDIVIKDHIQHLTGAPPW